VNEGKMKKILLSTSPHLPPPPPNLKEKNKAL